LIADVTRNVVAVVNVVHLGLLTVRDAVDLIRNETVRINVSGAKRVR